ncbi:MULTISPECIES: MFS transporter [unclassified Streptomyces]|uniref:MFS transporter n=1 Tax=unclassified Streptomyces TaxID=2593676 RepID=UPI000B2D243D|nr:MULTISPECIES: MFS transporter [unclassified Streptomyces]MCH0556916.1 MFS transporter [Streptomyces sp. MUM 16J]
MPGAWGTTWMLLAFMLVNFADKAVMGLGAPKIISDLHLTHGQFGMAQSAFFALFSLSALAVSSLTRRISTGVLLLTMALAWSAAQLPMLLQTSGFGVLVATRVLLGAAEGPALPVATHHVYGWFGHRERTLPTAVLLIGAAAGVAVSAPVLSWVIDRWGWRWAFGAVGFAGLAWAALWNGYGRKGPLQRADDRPEEGAPPAALPYHRILLSRTWLTAAFGSFAAYWMLSSSLTWGPDYLDHVAGLSLTQTGLLVTLAAVGNAASLLSHALLTRRTTAREARGHPARRRLPSGAGSGLLMCAAACAVAVFVSSDTLWVKIVMMVGPMTLTNVIMTVSQTACARVAPPERRGVVLGALAFVYALAGILAPLVTGRVVDAAGDLGTGYRTAYLLTAGLVGSAGALAACFLRPEKDARRLGVPEQAGPAPVLAH